MTEPIEPDLIALATPYALHAMSESEVADIDRLVAAAPAEVAQAFAEEVRAIRETMAVMSAATAVEPPQQLRDRVLAEVSGAPVVARCGRETKALADGGAGRRGRRGDRARRASRSGRRCGRAPSTAEQVFAAPDVQTVSGEIPTGGTATVVFSREKNAGVLVMNDVAPPEAGHGVPDVADRRQGPAFGGDDGRQGRRAVDHRGAWRPRRLPNAGLHRRTRQRIVAADHADHSPSCR